MPEYFFEKKMKIGLLEKSVSLNYFFLYTSWEDIWKYCS